MTNEDLWQAAMGEIELSISKANFITWFKNTAILSYENGKVIIGVPNGFSKEWLENKYRNYIIKALQNFQKEVREISCTIYVPSNIGLNEQKNVDAIKTPAIYSKEGDFPEFSPVISRSNLNPRYIFENFIIGESNELARAACYAVSQNPGRVYNPLFIYGGVGLGKTHLLQSIGNDVLKKDPLKKVLYITSERFASELIDSIKNQKVSDFKNEYQKIDLLIIDDIQFLADKEKTQNEFFHVFNVLYQLNKQIVISSDRPPKEISALEERLRSRFEGGMIADVGRPDLETRMAILKEKSTEKGFSLSDDITKFIAENIKNNIRELEGALNKVIASSELEGTVPDLDFVKKTLGAILSSGKKKGVNHQNVVELVSEFYNIKTEDLLSKGRKQEVAWARQVAMYLMRNELNLSYPSIGEKFGGRDHTTALHAFEKINKELGENEKLQEAIFVLKDRLYRII
ncbi:MAG: chromosomal replication initiator protein DnaA [bacterium]|nr:chromosomal replication initiator protein DnaA [bacterium]